MTQRDLHIVIRLAQRGDARALAHVIVDTGRTAHAAYVPQAVLTATPLEEAYAESERNWARALREIAEAAEPDECICVACDEAGAVIGLAMGGPPRQEIIARSGEIYVLYVCTEHQGQGIGRRLVQAVAAYLAQRGRTALLIGCLAANAPARRFYEALGGKVVAERDFDQDGILLPEVVYGWTDTLPLIDTGET